MDSEKETNILNAALEVFLRFGFKKATMGDIAEKAGMSRPAVYLVFPNKEDIFRAVIARKVEDFSRESQEKLAGCTGLKAGMAAVLDSWILEPYEMISASPEAEELLESGYAFAPDLRERSLQQMEEQLLQVIRSAPEAELTAVAKSGVGVEVVARLIAVSTHELKHGVGDVAQLRELLNATVEIHASYLTGHSSRNG